MTRLARRARRSFQVIECHVDLDAARQELAAEILALVARNARDVGHCRPGPASWAGPRAISAHRARSSPERL
jgi:hypothetical protein